MIKTCSVCQSEFTCTAQENEQPCWCAALPAIMPTEVVQDCRCPSCLALAISENIKSSIKSNSLEKMIEISSAYRKNKSLIEHIDYTVKNHRTIFSKWYHLKRGECCGNGCVNCSY